MYFAVTITFMLIVVGWAAAMIAAAHHEEQVGLADNSYTTKVCSVVALGASFCSVALMFWIYPVGSYWGVVLLYSLGAVPVITIPAHKWIGMAWLVGILLMFELITETPEDATNVLFLAVCGIGCLLFSLIGSFQDDSYQ